MRNDTVLKTGYILAQTYRQPFTLERRHQKFDLLHSVVCIELVKKSVYVCIVYLIFLDGDSLLSTNLNRNKTENTFSLQSVSQNLHYTNFPINRVHKFPKAEDTQLVQSKSPKLSNVKVSQIVKAQVTQSSSHPKLKSPNVQVAQIAKSPSCPQVHKFFNTQVSQ